MVSLPFPISRLVDPTLVILAALGLGLWLHGERWAALTRRKKIGRALAWSGWLALWLLTMPWVASALVRGVSLRPRDLHEDLASTPPERRAMVVLSAGIDADEFGEPAMERLSAPALERCIGAARVYREYGFGYVIVSGRDPDLAPTELASGMADLIAALGVPREKLLLEAESLDTKENALFSTRLLRTLPVDKVVVVTSALHMPRALKLFERAGLSVLPAPVKFQPEAPKTLERFIPSALALRRSQRAVHELVGLLEP
jgi:uncharacterized SAM-binding protein YcdF (DUF218 family)